MSNKYTAEQFSDLSIAVIDDSSDRADQVTKLLENNGVKSINVLSKLTVVWSNIITYDSSLGCAGAFADVDGIFSGIDLVKDEARYPNNFGDISALDALRVLRIAQTARFAQKYPTLPFQYGAVIFGCADPLNAGQFAHEIGGDQFNVSPFEPGAYEKLGNMLAIAAELSYANRGGTRTPA